jgi:ribosome-associated protein
MLNLSAPQRFIEPEAMPKKSHKGYYVKGEFIAAGSDDDRHIRNELQEANALSRTALKKASEKLEEIGEELLFARENLVAELPLPEELRDAILDAKEFTSFGAKRRQTKFIGKLMRRLNTEELEAIRAALQVEHGQSVKDAQILHRAEKWRDSLISDDEQLGQWIDEFPGGDVQHLRALIRQARKDAEKTKPGVAQRQGRAYRQIFSLVRSQLSSAASNS